MVMKLYAFHHLTILTNDTLRNYTFCRHWMALLNGKFPSSRARPTITPRAGAAQGGNNDIANTARRIEGDLRISGAYLFVQRNVRAASACRRENIGTQYMFQADGGDGSHQLFQRDAGIFLPAANRHLLVAVFVYANVQRQHQLRAKTFKPAFHRVRGFHRR